MGPLEPGTAVAGYRIVRLLRGGPGAGAVYEATGGGLDRAVALKVFAERLSESAEFRERFRREAPRIAAVEHPSIARTYEAGSSKSGLYLAMRLVEGRTLWELLERGPLEPEAALELLGPVAEGLDLAHDNGVLHRDLKPGKILIGEPGRAFLTGFSMPRPQARGARGSSRRARGAVLYLAPEQIRGEPARRPGEVYSFGVLLYEALAGSPPFRAHADEAAISGSGNGSPPSLLVRRPELPERLDEIFARALSTDPRERPGRASEMVADLRRALRPATPGARLRPVMPVDRTPLPAPAAPEVSTPDPSPATREVSRPDRPPATREIRRPDPPPATREVSRPDKPPAMREGSTPDSPMRVPAVSRPNSPSAAASLDERLGRRRASSLAARRRGARGAVPAIAALTAAAAVAGWYLPDLVEQRETPSAVTPAGAPAPTSDAYEAALSRTFERLNERRATLEARLARARAAPGQARAADALAQAHADAARALVSEPRTQQEQSTSTSIVAALRDVATAYRALASSARRGDARSFRVAAARAGRADARVRRAVGRLTAIGYSVE